MFAGAVTRVDQSQGGRFALTRSSISPIAGGRAAGPLAQAAQALQLGRIREAAEPMRLAATLEPNNAIVFETIGSMCLEAGLFSEAAAAFRRTIHIKPRSAAAYWRLGAALQQSGAFEAATAALQQAIELQPRLPDAHYRLGLLLEQRGDRRGASLRYRSVLSGGPPPRLRRLAEARALLTEGKDEEAETKLRHVVKVDPNDADALALLAALRMDAGAFEEAAACFERALAQTGSAPDLYYHLVRCRKITAGDAELLKRLRAAAAESRGAASTRIRLRLALGKALDDLGQYGEAMQNFDAAAEIREIAFPSNVAAFEERVDKTIQCFSAEFIERNKSAGPQDPSAVFIFGMPRSGTTLNEQIVSAHPMAHGAGETQFWTRRGALMDAAKLDADAEFIQKVAEDCLRDLRDVAGGAARIIDKNPFNFRFAGLIHLALPGAAMIHCRRSPRDTALSIHQTFFSEMTEFPAGGEALVRYYRAYERLTAHWRRVLPADRYLEVDYEELTADPVLHSERLIAHIGLEWDDGCLRPEMNFRRVKTATRWQIRQPIHRSSVERWRKYEAYLGPLADLPPTSGSNSGGGAP